MCNNTPPVFLFCSARVTGRRGNAWGVRCHSTHGGANGTARTCVERMTGARTTRPATLRQHADSLASRRSFASPVPALRGGESAVRRVSQHQWGHSTHGGAHRRARASQNIRRTHDGVGGARSTRRLARGPALARRRRFDSGRAEWAVRGNVVSLGARRRTTTVRPCVNATTSARTTKSAALGRRDKSLAVGGARSSRRLARGLALARRRRCRLRSSRTNGAKSRGALMSLDARRHTTTARPCVDATTSARTTRLAALSRRDESLAARRSLCVGGVGSDGAEPAMRRDEHEVSDNSTHGGARPRRARASRSDQRTHDVSAALGRRYDSLAARRSLCVASVGSSRAEPVLRQGA